ncbi:MAG: hypothetical protein PF439_01705, partial [Helicobacteraceae bacterium]|nr:hypothetical protein [Helicobacteraceae bacterium]
KMAKLILQVQSIKSSRFGVSWAEVIPKAYIGTSSGKLKRKSRRIRWRSSSYRFKVLKVSDLV